MSNWILGFGASQINISITYNVNYKQVLLNKWSLDGGYLLEYGLYGWHWNAKKIFTKIPI